MRLILTKDAQSGSTFIPKGEYWVSLHQDMQMIYLSAGGRDFKIRATKKSNRSRYKTTTLIFANAGGVFWQILVATPRYGEWVGLIELGASKDKEDKKHH